MLERLVLWGVIYRRLLVLGIEMGNYVHNRFVKGDIKGRFFKSVVEFGGGVRSLYSQTTVTKSWPSGIVGSNYIQILLFPAILSRLSLDFLELKPDPRASGYFWSRSMIIR